MHLYPYILYIYFCHWSLSILFVPYIYYVKGVSQSLLYEDPYSASGFKEVMHESKEIVKIRYLTFCIIHLTVLKGEFNLKQEENISICH